MCAVDNVEMLNVMLAANLNVNTKISKIENVAIVQTLLSHDADVDSTEIYLAAGRSHTRILNILFEKFKEDNSREEFQELQIDSVKCAWKKRGAKIDDNVQKELKKMGVAPKEVNLADRLDLLFKVGSISVHHKDY
eukprot:Awhi_evm1s1706